jgi:NADH-quinone oxidoreductase subunit G
MTVTKPESADGPPAPVETVSATIDGIPVTVPVGTLIIRAAELVGIQVPRFCDHPLLDPLGACRQCIVEVEGQRKPLTACTSPVTDGMAIKTQLTSQVAEKAQKGTIEFLLLNHPLDCPVCDKGGECPLQNQTLANGAAESRFKEVKRTYPKPIAISSQVLLDRERCVLCARCTRFSQQIAGDPFIELFERGALEQVGIYEDEPFSSYFSGNTVQICPVGALTGSQYRFRARPFDLVSTSSVCEHCSSGCQQRTDWRRGKVLRRLAGEDDAVNEEWNCDKGRWAFQYATARNRITTPLVRDAEGYLVEASWTEALGRAADGLRENRGRTGVLTGGRLTVEDAYAYSKFARVALGTNDIDFRARPHTAEEQDFLVSSVAGRYLETTYDDLEAAPAVLLAGFEPEEESPIVFLRLRKGFVTHASTVFGVAPYGTDGFRKLGGRLLQAAPGTEGEVLAALAADDDRLDETGAAALEALRAPGAVILVGERLASSVGALSAAARLAASTGASLAWVPRRAGDRGALEAGCLPGLLPGGRPLADTTARGQVDAVWGSQVPLSPGRDGDTILSTAAAGGLALLVAGVDPGDLADPALAIRALSEAPFVVSLEIRESAVTERADVVLPVATVVAKAGSYLDWEGRVRPFDATLESTGAMSDGRVLHRLAAEMGIDLGIPDLRTTQAEIARLGAWNGARPAAPATAPGAPPRPAAGEAVLATWHHLLDEGRLQEDEPHLAGTRRPAVLRLSAATAAGLGVSDGGHVTVTTAAGSVTLPLVITDLPEHVVWLPTNSEGSSVHATLGVGSGAIVRLSAGAAGEGSAA